MYCVPLPDFLALNFPSPSRVTQNSILVHPTTTDTNQSQRQITVQRIGRDARPLRPSEIARYQHMFTNQRSETSRRSEVQNFVSENTTRSERPENSRLRNLAQRIPRLTPIVPWSERSRLQIDRFDQDYVLRFPIVDISRISGSNSRIMNPAPTHTVNPEAVVNNPRPPVDNADLEYN